jgi:hypothetical protein
MARRKCRAAIIRAVLRRLTLGFVAVALAITLAACGGDSDSSDDSPAGTPAGTTQPDEAPPALDPEAFAEADEGDVEVIRGWTDALRAGDIDAAASFFALPSVAENGAVLIQISTEADARDFNNLLPCGAFLIGAQSVGEFTTAEFELTERPGSTGCGVGVGVGASTAFVITDGKIAEWRRVNNDGQPPPSGTTV